MNHHADSMSKFDWSDLDGGCCSLLVAVVETGSITGAAQRWASPSRP
jgi:molybdenum-dependent DNA-binding transcriptional regulator ModE